MKLNELKTLFGERLRKRYTEGEIERLFHILLEDLAEISSTKYLLNSNKEIEISIETNLLKGLKSLEDGKPYQQVVGFVPFAGLYIAVNAHVLIPRPETEELAYIIRGELQKQASLSIFDIGTGSGCLALSLAAYGANYNVVGGDVSEAAIAQAKENAIQNNLQLRLQCSDFLNRNTWEDKNWDVIVSNPPYIAEQEQDEMDDLVLNNEPWNALFVPDTSPLIFYSRIAEYASTRLNAGGKVYVEINQKLGSETSEEFKKYGFSVDLIKDLNGNDRFIKAWC